MKGNPRTSSFDRRSRSVVAAILVAAGILAPPFVLSSCGVKPPEIASVEWRIESRPRPEGSKADNSLNMYESLSVFGSIKDDAGLDNISELWIVHDASCLAWKLTDADWTKTSSGEDIWIGTSALATPELGSLPRGDYRMIAIDAAGARAELGFTVAGEFPEKTPPRIAYGNGTLSVHSDWPETLALAFDEAGALITSVAAPTAASSLSDEFGKDIALRTTEIGAYGYDPTLQMGSFSRRITTR